MIKDDLKLIQPRVYEFFDKVLKNNKLTHALLLEGIEGSLKKEAAIFLAQSLVCENSYIACETCNSCKRILDNNYVDYLFIDCSDKQLLKEDVDNIHNKFINTALEKANKKIYIIHNIENASAKAVNALLKFLEEPNDTYAIFTCSNVARVYETIVSRCQIVRLNNTNSEIYYKKAIDDGIDNLHSYLISNIKPSLDMVSVSEDKEYIRAFEAFKCFIENTDLEEVLYEFQINYFNDGNKNRLIYFLDLLILFYRDKLKDNKIEDSWYNDCIDNIIDKDYSNTILLLTNCKDDINKSGLNINLLIDRLFYDLMEEKYE